MQDFMESHFRPLTRHGLVVGIAGLYYVFYGITMLTYSPRGPRWQGMHLALRWAPLWFWALAFIFVGLAAGFSGRWPMTPSSWGYQLLTGWSSGWAAVHILGVFFDRSPISNLSTGVGWALIAFLWWGISGLVDPATGLGAEDDGVG